MGVMYMVLLVLFLWVENWARAQAQLLMMLMAQRGTVAICHLLLRKAVRLRVGVAPAVIESSLIGGDIIAKNDYLSVFVVGSMSLFTLVSAIATLFVLIGWPALIGIACLCASFVVAANIGLHVKRLADKSRHAQDATVAAIVEIVHGAKLCKLQQWEEPMVSYVGAKRRAELRLLRRLRALLATMMIMGRSAPIIASMCTLLTYAANGTLTAQTVFPVLSLFSALRQPFYHRPHPLRSCRPRDGLRASTRAIPKHAGAANATAAAAPARVVGWRGRGGRVGSASTALPSAGRRAPRTATPMGA